MDGRHQGKFPIDYLMRLILDSKSCPFAARLATAFLYTMPISADNPDSAPIVGHKCGWVWLTEMTMEESIGWGSLALINAGLAQCKGRSGLGWFFISIFLGPIATFIIVVLDPVKQM